MYCQKSVLLFYLIQGYTVSCVKPRYSHYKVYKFVVHLKVFVYQQIFDNFRAQFCANEFVVTLVLLDDCCKLIATLLLICSKHVVTLP